MKRSESISQFSKALARAQGQIRNAVKAEKNTYYNSKYADLGSIVDACRAPLAENCIAVIQLPRVNEETVEIETILSHESGEWISEVLVLPATGKGKDGSERFDVQTVGSAITYGRRYALAAMAGVATEDDDGNAAMAAAPARNGPRPNDAERQQQLNNEQLRQQALRILNVAAPQGSEAYRTAWDTLSEPMRRACVADHATLKAQAFKVDEQKATEKKGVKNAPAV